MKNKAAEKAIANWEKSLTDWTRRLVELEKGAPAARALLDEHSSLAAKCNVLVQAHGLSAAAANRITGSNLYKDHPNAK